MPVTPSSDAQQISGFLSGAARHWGLLLTEGILLLILGTLAFLAPVIASVAATVFFGWLLLVSGVVGLITTLRARQAPGFGCSLLSALLGIGAGVVLLGWPVQGAFSLTTVLIAFLFFEGILSILYALEHRRGLSGRWGWMLASGIVDVILGAMLLAGLPGTALWAIGVLVGINMIFGGWALITMGLYGRSVAKAGSAAATH